MKRLLQILTIAALLHADVVRAAVTVTETKGNGDFKEFNITTDWYSLKVIEEVGGWGKSFKMPKDGPEWIPQGPEYRAGGGLFVHNLTGRVYSSDPFPFAPRKISIVENMPEKVVLKVEYEPQGEPKETRLMTFSGTRPLITVETEFVNSTGQSYYRGLWPKIHAFAGGTMADNSFFRADTHGPNYARYSEKAKAAVIKSKGIVDNDIINDPVEGWMAQLNEKTGTGFLTLMNYNDLKTLYNSLAHATFEWFYEDAPLRRDGGTWKTTYQIVPISGWKSMDYASANIMAAHELRKSGDAFSLHSRYGETTVPVSELTVSMKWRPLADMEAPFTELPPAKLDSPGNGKEIDIAVPGAPVGKSLLFEIALTGKTGDGKAIDERYQYVHEEEDARRFDLLAGIYLPTYTRPQPAKNRVYDKPKDFRIKTSAACTLLEVRGPGYYRVKTTEAAGKAHLLDVKGSYLKKSFNGSDVSYFPMGYEDMAQYTVIVLNKVNAPCLKHFSREMIVDFVKGGGGLLIVGGPYSLSNGKYQETQLDEILPVTLSGKPFSWKKVEGDKRIIKAETASLLRDEKLPKAFSCEWMEALTPKSGATVELTVGDQPFLVTWEVKGKHSTGRVAVIAGSVYGDSPEGFWNAPEWPGMLSRVLSWLNKDARLLEVP